MPKWLAKWRLVEMELWDQEFIDLVQPGFIAFGRSGSGEMGFGAVELTLDWKADANSKVSFSFHGFDEGDEVSGRGWAKVTLDRMTGRIDFARGDNSGFIASRFDREAAR
jgi:hypothetical protein